MSLNSPPNEPITVENVEATLTASMEVEPSEDKVDKMDVDEDKPSEEPKNEVEMKGEKLEEKEVESSQKEDVKIETTNKDTFSKRAEAPSIEKEKEDSANVEAKTSTGDNALIQQHKDAEKFFAKPNLFGVTDALNMIMDTSAETASEFEESVISNVSRNEPMEETSELQVETEESASALEIDTGSDEEAISNAEQEIRDKNELKDSTPAAEANKEVSNDKLTVQESTTSPVEIEPPKASEEAAKSSGDESILEISEMEQTEQKKEDTPKSPEKEIKSPNIFTKMGFTDSPGNTKSVIESPTSPAENIQKPVEKSMPSPSKDKNLPQENNNNQKEKPEYVLEKAKPSEVDKTPAIIEKRSFATDTKPTIDSTSQSDSKITATNEVIALNSDESHNTPLVQLQNISIKTENVDEDTSLDEPPKKKPRPKSTSPKNVAKTVSTSGKVSPPAVKQKKKRPPPKDDGQDGLNDFYCWICHREGEVLCCELCPRVFHAKCLRMAKEPEGDWFCPECEKITNAECAETRSRAMANLTTDQLAIHLRYVVQRLKTVVGSEPFHEPVDTNLFPDYKDYIFHPMDLSTIEKKVKKGEYGSTEAFSADLKWIVHNCIIYNSINSVLTATAKKICRSADRELSEIEVCPECYLKSCRRRDNWFCDPCKEVHPLVWAKLQGFPHWPAKALRIEKSMVDVRFFGQHDRAWIPLSGCYLLSKDLPAQIKNKKKGRAPSLRGGLDNAMQEMQVYIDNVIKLTGKFDYAPPRTPLTHCDLHRSSEGSTYAGSAGYDDTPLKKVHTVTTSGEHPARGFSKKKKAAMQHLDKTIESCKASLGIEKVKEMNQSSEEETSSDEDQLQLLENKLKKKEKEKEEKPEKSASVADDDSDAELVIDLNDDTLEKEVDTPKESTPNPSKTQEPSAKSSEVEKRKKDIAKTLAEKTADKTAPKTKMAVKRKMEPETKKVSPSINKVSKHVTTSDELRSKYKKSSYHLLNMPKKETSFFTNKSFNKKAKHKMFVGQKEEQDSGIKQSNLKETAKNLAKKIANKKRAPETDVTHESTNHTPTTNGAALSKFDKKMGIGNFKKYSDRVMNTLESVFYEIYSTIVEPQSSNHAGHTTDNSSQQLSATRLELQRLKWMHQQELAEIKHNHALVESEMRQSLENEKNQLMREMKQLYEREKAKAVEETKKKQWCASCGNEAMFYCCWNTSYCDYPCQQRHWPQHMGQCTQAMDNDSSSKNDSAKPNDSKSIETQQQAYTQSSLVVASSLPVTKLTTSASSSYVPKGILISTSKPFVKPITESNQNVKVYSAGTAQQRSISAIGARLLAAKQKNVHTDKPLEMDKKLPSYVPVPIGPSIADSPASPTHEKVEMDSPLSPDISSSIKKSTNDPFKNANEKQLSNTSDKAKNSGLPVIEPVLQQSYLSNLHKILPTNQPSSNQDKS